MARNALQWLTDRLVLNIGGRSFTKQAGAIPYTVVGGQVVFLLITSRGSGRWIFPKGEMIKGLEPWEGAEQEALEEAGIEGEVERQPIGFYRTFKTRAFHRRIVGVTMYPLRVTHQFDDWPEKGSRLRHWALLPEVKRLLSDKSLAQLAVDLNRRLRRQSPVPSQPPIERISA